MRAVLIAMLTAVAVAAVSTPSAHAARVHDCGQGEGGGYRNVTALSVACPQANVVAHELFVRIVPCLRRSEVRHSACTYRSGVWTARTHWVKDRYGLWQMDVRATARDGSVVRFQTDWDGE